MRRRREERAGVSFKGNKGNVMFLLGVGINYLMTVLKRFAGRMPCFMIRELKCGGALMVWCGL